MAAKSPVRTDRAPAPFQGAPYSQAIRVGDFRAILEAAGSGLDRLVKTTVFLSRLEDFAGMNEVYRRHAGDVPPARSTVEVGKFPGGALLEIEAIAHL